MHFECLGRGTKCLWQQVRLQVWTLPPACRKSAHPRQYDKRATKPVRRETWTYWNEGWFTLGEIFPNRSCAQDEREVDWRETDWCENRVTFCQNVPDNGREVGAKINRERRETDLDQNLNRDGERSRSFLWGLAESANAYFDTANQTSQRHQPTCLYLYNEMSKWFSSCTHRRKCRTKTVCISETIFSDTRPGRNYLLESHTGLYIFKCFYSLMY